MFLARPKDALLADGDSDGEAGDAEINVRRFEVGTTGPAAGESQKNEPSPGEPKEPASLNDGD